MTRGPERAPEKDLAAFVDHKRNLSHQDPAAVRKTNAILGSLNSSLLEFLPGLLTHRVEQSGQETKGLNGKEAEISRS